MTALRLGSRVMRGPLGREPRLPDGPWVIVRDLRDARGVWVVAQPDDPSVSVWAYPEQLTAETEDDILRRCGGVRLPGEWRTTKGLPHLGLWLGEGRAWLMPDAQSLAAASRGAYALAKSQRSAQWSA